MVGNWRFYSKILYFRKASKKQISAQNPLATEHLTYHMSFLPFPPSLWETARYIMQYPVLNGRYETASDFLYDLVNTSTNRVTPFIVVFLVICLR